MDEITDQFRTEDAEEFKQLQAELEVAGQLDLFNYFLPKFGIFFLAKNCRILQFKLRKAEKRSENMEAEKNVLEGMITIYFSCNMKLIFIIYFVPVSIFFI